MLRKYMQKISDAELFAAFDEYQELQRTGTLQNGIARNLLKKSEELYHNKFSLSYIEKEVYYEMAKRYYHSKKEE